MEREGTEEGRRREEEATSDEKKSGENYARTRIKMKSSLMNGADNVAPRTLKTRNSNASRNCHGAVIPDYFRETRIRVVGGKNTTIIVRDFFLPVL